MKIQYIGTGAAEGFPGMFCRCAACMRARQAGGRNLKTRSCVLINDHILIDLSPDLYARSLQLGLELGNVTDLVVTHTHADHLDLFSLALRARDGATVLPDVVNGENVLPVYGNARVGAALEDALQNQPHANAARLRHILLADGCWQTVGELSVYPLRANHKPDEECFLYVITDGRYNLFYANDTGRLPEETWKRLKDLNMVFDAVSMDAARGTLPGDGHMGIAENLELRNWMIKEHLVRPDTQYYLTHLSHMSGIIHDELEALMGPKGFMTAYDGLVIPNINT